MFAMLAVFQALKVCTLISLALAFKKSLWRNLATTLQHTNLKPHNKETYKKSELISQRL